MCFAAAAPLLTVASSVMSGIGAQAQANAQANQAEYNAAVARVNANTSRQTGHARSETIATKYRRQEGAMTAAYGRAGVVPTSGSAALVLGENARNAWLDANNAIWNAETEAVGYQNKATDLEAQAKATRSAGSISMASSFLSGLASASIRSRGGGAGTSLTIDDT